MKVVNYFKNKCTNDLLDTVAKRIKGGQLFYVNVRKISYIQLNLILLDGSILSQQEDAQYLRIWNTRKPAQQWNYNIHESSIFFFFIRRVQRLRLKPFQVIRARKHGFRKKNLIKSEFSENHLQEFIWGFLRSGIGILLVDF